MIEAELDRARNDLGASTTLADAGYGAQAVSSAYYAAFHAATAALLVLGESRSKHSGVISAFGDMVVRERGFHRETAKILRELFNDRGEADYDLGEVTRDDAAAAIVDAERFVAAVEDWIEGQTGGA